MLESVSYPGSVFWGRASGLLWALVVTVAVLLTVISVTSAWAGPTRLVSHRTVLDTGIDGTTPDKGVEKDSDRPSMSSNGRWVVFEADADNFFTSKDDNGLSDIYLHDVKLGYTVRLTYGIDGKAANGGSYGPKISPNGEWIVFWSKASNLVSGDSNGGSDVFRVKRPLIDVDGATAGYSNERASVKSTNTQLAEPSFTGSVADDGTVAFYTEAAIDPKDTNATQDIYIRSAPSQAKSTKLVSAATGGSAGNSISFMPQISGDGKKVAYTSMATDLTTGKQCKPSPCMDAYITELVSKKTTLLSKSSDNLGSDGWSSPGSISYSGKSVGLWSSASNLVPGLQGNTGRAYYWKNGEVVNLSKDDSNGADVSKSSDSSDGRYVAYVKKGQPGTESVYLFDSQANTTKLVSENGSGTAVAAQNPEVSGDGAYVAFDSNATVLKENYLGQGLYMWGELLIDIKNGVKLCGSGTGKKECRGVYIRNTKSDIEPGPYEPDEAIMEPLVKVEKSSSKAGSATDLVISLKRPFKYHEFKSTEFSLPAGIGANTNVAMCTLDQAKKDKCPVGTKVGKLHTDIVLANNLVNIPKEYYKEGENGDIEKAGKSSGVHGDVYFCQPDAGEVGKLCAIVYDKYLMEEPIVVELDITLDIGSHYRMQVASSDITNTINAILTNTTDGDFVPLGTVYPNITGIQFTIFGDGAGNTTNDHPFITNSTFQDADPEIPGDEKKFLAEISNWGGTLNKREVPYQVEDAGLLSLNPAASIGLSASNGSGASDLAFKLTKPATDADLRKVETTLPKGVWVNSTADVEFCSKSDADAGNCGKAGGSGKSVGSAAAGSPLVKGLTGDVFLVDGAKPGDPMEMAVQLEQKMGTKGKIEIGFTCKMKLDSSKRINVVCDDLPPYTVTGVELYVKDLLTTGGIPCGSGTQELSADAKITPWAKEVSPVSLKPKVTVNSDCTGAAQSPFGPQLAVTSDDHTAGASPGKLELSVTRKASDDPLTDFDLTLPQGMVGDLDATPAKCALSQAEGPGCPVSSKIGSVEATAQIFNNKTITVEGGLYNAAPGTGEFGRFIASFDLPEIAGGGKLVLKSAVNPIDNAQAIVTKVVGAPPEFSITDIKMNLLGKTASGTEGPLLINPTFASNGSFTLDATSAHSLKANSSAPYPVTGSLGFTPHLSASLSTTKLGAKPVISTEISQQVQETAIKGMRLSFKGFGLDIAKGLSGCSALDRGMGSCPPASKVADITAHSWLIPTPLQGSLYLGEGAKTAFMSLNGPITLNVEGDVSIDASKGAVSVDINKGLPPISGSRIQATVGEGLFKNPDKCGTDAEISLDALSYAGQSYAESKKFGFCNTTGSKSAASLKVKLRPDRANSYTKASFILTQSEKKKAKKLKGLEIRLGKGKKALRASTKALKRKTSRSRRAKTVGTISLASAKKGRSVKAKVQVKRGRIYISPSTKQLRRYKRTIKRLRKKKKSSSKAYRRARRELKHAKKVHRHLKKKTKVRISRGKLRLVRMPTGDAYWRVYVKIDGKRYRTLRNPKRPGKVTFNAKAKTSSGSSIKATRTVKVKKAKKRKKK